MPVGSWARRAAILATCLGATAFVSTAVASAATVPGENIFGMGSSLQAVAQIATTGPSGTGSTGSACPLPTGWNGWVSDWHCTATDHSTLSNSPAVTAEYTIESSGVGLAEFGDAASASCASTTGVLSPACDPNANAKGELDEFIGTDDPPSSTQNSNAAAAAGGGVQQITLPVAQAPVAMIFSLPAGITMGSTGNLKLTTSVLANLWGSGGVPGSAACSGGVAGSANTWCGFLEAAGLKRITSGTPTASQFLDTTTNNGGNFTLYERSKGSGTTFSFRGYLYEADQWLGLGDYPYGLVTDGPSDWPSTAPGVTQSQTGPLGANGSNGTLVENTCETPGSAGYANLADAVLDSVQPFTVTPTTTTCGGTASHQVIFARVQDNQGDGLAPNYASPAGATAGTANVYTGSNINGKAGSPATTCTAQGSSGGVGCWVVPSTDTGTWQGDGVTTFGTIPSDPDVYDHGKPVGGTTPAKNYPIVANTYDVFWTQYDAAGSNLIGMYNDSSCNGTNDNTCAGDAAKSYAVYLTGTGQSNLAGGHVYYSKMPSAIASQAKTYASKIVP